jgi:RNA-directed DNA polymerase
VSPLLALIARHGMDAAITQVSPEARVIAYADDCVVLHADRSVVEHGQHLFITWLAAIGLTLNVANTRPRHTLAGDQPGMDVLGCHIRQYRVGTHPSGKGPRGHQWRGCTTLIKPAKANVKAHLAALGRIIRRGRAWPHAALIRHLNPTIRGWANDDRTWVSQATCSRLDHLTWVKLRHWARRRHPNASAGWVYDRYWPRWDSRRVFATPATPQGQVYLTSHREVPSLWHAKVAGHRSPYEGDWVYGSTRRGRDPTVGP